MFGSIFTNTVPKCFVSVINTQKKVNLAEIEEGNYTDEQLHEIGRLKGQCVAIYSKSALKLFKDGLKDTINELEGAIEGFLNAFE